MFGFWTHVVGFFCDSAMAIRVKSKHTAFNTAALIAVTVYTLTFVAWLLWLIVVRYSDAGKTCSGESLLFNAAYLPYYTIN